jgi:type I site-specific restriction endonuclease
MEFIQTQIEDFTVLLKTISSSMAEDAEIIKKAKEAKERFAIQKKEHAAVTNRLNELKWEWMELNWADIPTEEEAE